MTPNLPPEGGPSIPPRGLGPTLSTRSDWQRRRIFVLLAALALALLTLPALANPSRPALCEAAAREAAEKTGVPLSVLRAIMLTVSGRKSDTGLVPWPWTVGADGQRVWFETADDARAYAYQQLKAGQAALGLGCFQVDYAKYGAEFASLEDMLTPRINAEFAASLLVSLQAQTGGWGAAVAAFQSLDPAEEERWLATFYRHRDALRHEDHLAMADLADGGSTPEGRRLNTYPLLVDTGAAQVMGSLVPVGPPAAGAGIFPSAEGL